MMDLLEMMRKAHGGAAVEELAGNFGLSQDMAQDMMAAFVPAFAESLKHNTADPMGMGQLLSAMSANPFANYYQDAAAAYSPQGLAEGRKAMENLFRVPGMEDAVSAQVAAMTGASQKAAQEMFPVLAVTFMGGLAKQMTFGPVREALENFFDGFNRGRPKKADYDPFGSVAAMKPFTDAWMGFFTGLQPGKQSGETPDQAPQEPTSDQKPEAGEFRVFDDMVSAGQDLQQSHVQAMRDLMDTYWKKA